LDSKWFSPEIGFATEILVKKLRQMSSKGLLDETINCKVLSLLFSFLNKIETHPDIYVFPYIKQKKQTSVLSDLILKTHSNNLKNLFHTFTCFFTGTHPFVDNVLDAWNREFVVKLN
jgi:hypothetical protein